MGEEETGTEVAETAANGTITPEQEVEDVPQMKDVEKHGVKEMEEDGKDDEKVGTQKMDVDSEGKENVESKEGEKIEEKEETINEESKEDEEEKEEETRKEAMEEEMEVKENEESEEKVEEKVDELKEEEERAEKSKQEKGSKRRGKGKTPVVKAKSNKKEVEEKQQKTPVASTIERPVRERKSVERLVESVEKEYVKEFHIEKGRGTALKDIPNVAFKLSKRKADDSLKLLHTVLFGRRGKAVLVKSNISRFSGFVWNENEEKQKIKVKEKFDKCVKEKLLEFCDVLDITIAKANIRKEDIVAKLIDFLVAPHATTSELLAEKEQSSKGKKRKRVVKHGASMSDNTPSKLSAKTRRKIENASKERENNNTPETENESDEEEEKEEEEGEHEEEENVNGVPERSKSEVPEHSESEENKDEFEDESEEDTRKGKRGSKKLSAKKESAGKVKAKKVATPKKFSPPTKRTPVKSSSKRSKVDDSSDTSPKTFSRKKRTEIVKEKSSIPKKPASMEKAGKKVVKGKDKPKEDKLRPSDDELRNAICEILKEVDFNTATFTDILKQLAGRFSTDLTPRKSSIKLMIQDELTKLADDEEDEGDVEKDETRPSSQGVEA